MFQKLILILIDNIIMCIGVIFYIYLLKVVEMQLLLWSSNILCLFSVTKLNATDSSEFSIPVLKTSLFMVIFVLVLRNEFHFSGVHGAMNCSGSCAK